MVAFLLFIFLAELFFLVSFDYSIFGTVLTPTFFLGVPYGAVLFISVFVGPMFGFVPVSGYSILLWCGGLLCFWFLGALLGAVTCKKGTVPAFHPIRRNEIIDMIIRIISLIFIIILFLSLQKASSLYSIGSEAFSDHFSGHGIAAHCLSLLKFNCVYIYSSKRRSFPDFIIILLTFFFLFLYNVKGAIILTALACFISRIIIIKTRLSITKSVSFCLLGIFFFVVSYIISLHEVDMDFLVYHFITYVSAGVLGVSEHIRQKLPVDVDFFMLFQPIRNMINFVSGKEITDRICDIWVLISSVHQKNSNVKTFFGDIYIYSGVIKGILFSSLFGIFCYLSLLLVIIGKNVIFIVLYVLLVSSLMLGWFTFYFNDLFYYEVVLYVVLIYFFCCISKWLRVCS